MNTLHQPFFSAESYLKPLETYKMENFAYPVKNVKPISVYAKSLHLRCLKVFWMRLIAPGNVLCYHNKHPMRYFELLYGSRSTQTLHSFWIDLLFICCLLPWIPQQGIIQWIGSSCWDTTLKISSLTY